MRIIGGALRGRRLLSALGPATRPTSDRVREAVASALTARGAIEGARVLDAFGGTGAYGLEALSRGATSVLCVDEDRRAVECAQKNVDALGMRAQMRVLALDLLGSSAKVAAAIERSGLGPFDLVFADPPYALAQAGADRLAEFALCGLLAPGAVVVLEHAARAALVRAPAFGELAAYRYGDTAVALWETIAEPG